MYDKERDLKQFWPDMLGIVMAKDMGSAVCNVQDDLIVTDSWILVIRLIVLLLSVLADWRVYAGQQNKVNTLASIMFIFFRIDDCWDWHK